MAKFNWAGATVGLLGGVASEAKAHEARLANIENQRISDERETRRQEALLAKQMAMAKFQSDMQAGRDDVNWRRGEESKREQSAEQRADKESELATKERWRQEDRADARDQRSEAREERAAQKEGERAWRTQEKEYDRNLRRELTGGKENGALNDKEARRLYNDAYTKAYSAEMEEVISASPQQRKTAELKAHQYASKLTGFDLYGVLGGQGAGVRKGLLGEAADEPTQNSNAAPQGAIDMLKKNPSLAPRFKEKYGYLPPGF